MSKLPIYTINSDALNERFEYSPNKGAKVFRIITLGDSFTFGENISTSANWTELLENKLNESCVSGTTNKFEVINLGYSGYDTEYEVERYRLRGQKYNPDLVIWLATELDRYAEKIIELQKTMNITNAPSDGKKIMIGSWELAMKKIQATYSAKQLFDYQIIHFKNYINNYQNKKPILLISDQWDDLKWVLGESSIYYSNVFISADNTKLSFIDGHFNEEGNRIMMQKTFEYLRDGKLVPCKQ